MNETVKSTVTAVLKDSTVVKSTTTASPQSILSSLSDAVNKTSHHVIHVIRNKWFVHGRYIGKGKGHEWYQYIWGILMGTAVLLSLVLATSLIVYKLRQYRRRQMQSMMSRLPTEDEARLMFSNPLYPEEPHKTDLKEKLLETNNAINGM